MKSDAISVFIRNEWTCKKHNTWGRVGESRCVECENEELKTENTALKELLKECYPVMHDIGVMTIGSAKEKWKDLSQKINEVIG
jgi:hypothetical protein